MQHIETNIIERFTKPWNNDSGVYRDLENFAKSLKWYPSDIIEYKNPNSLITGHLIVEHGLENSAVVSFLNYNTLFSKLNSRERNNLLQLSYNNLIDFHFPIDKQTIFGIHNRIDKRENIIYKSSIENLSVDFFETILNKKKLSPNIKALDDALIDTISYWKRIISSEFNNQLKNEEFSNLFNAIIFSRAIEDNFNKSSTYNTPSKFELVNILNQNRHNVSIPKIFLTLLKNYKITDFPKGIIDNNNLKVFNKLDFNIIYKLFNDFYFNKFAEQYDYNFSIISKQALSRIYEKYVSILEVEESSQLNLFTPIPNEKINKISGSYYTPQFIARFFSRSVEQHFPNFKEKNFKIIEPAVGSGMFLRTLLEKKSENNDNTQIIEESFNNILGVDIHKTACQATKLSLSLLHLVVTDKLPKTEISIFNKNALEYFADKTEIADIVISNPPYVAYNRLKEVEKKQLKNFLEDLAFGKTDLYFAFIKIAIDSLKIGGIGLFVLPNTFLLSESSKKIRKYISDNANIKSIIDLSDVEVFGDIRIYTILIIFEKIDKKIKSISPSIIVAKIMNEVGEALYNVLKNEKQENKSYCIYEVNQDFFKTETIHLLPPSEYNLKSKLDKFQKLDKFIEVRTGFSSGSKEAFIIRKNEIPKKEKNIYIPFLPDREISAYTIPKSQDLYFFYPFINDKLIKEDKLKIQFPKSYQRLLKHKEKLAERTEVKSGGIEWFHPNRPRRPEFMLVPKIVTPHLVFTPKFAIDETGKLAVTRSPFLILNPKYKPDLPDEELDYFTINNEILFYFTAILNSSVCFWYLINHAPKYQKGYAMLEKRYLLDLPVPNPEIIDKRKYQKLIKLVKERIATRADKSIFIEKQIDKIVTELYNLTKEETKIIFFD
jgi:methylase of polypeptide subunit release factors